jgi:hypothetical protein
LQDPERFAEVERLHFALDLLISDAAVGEPVA